MGLYEYIKGPVAALTPASLVIDQAGVGYMIQISLQTYSQLQGSDMVMVWTEEIIREDSHTIFGFASREERELFRLLISVSGVGANTARMMLSSLSTTEIRRAIQTDNVPLIKSVKGIGIKTAQRVVIDLRDKIAKTEGATEIFSGIGNTARDEALSALVMLGFSKNDSAKVIDQLLSDTPATGAEELVKRALKKL